jgi:hypothetical protein
MILPWTQVKKNEFKGRGYRGREDYGNRPLCVGLKTKNGFVVGGPADKPLPPYPRDVRNKRDSGLPFSRNAAAKINDTRYVSLHLLVS